MNRPTKIIAWTVAGLLAVIAILIVILLTFDPNRLRPWINHKVTDSTGRAFAINGDLRVKWEKADDKQKGWRSWVPMPRISAEKITMANADWAQARGDMVDIDRVSFTVLLLPLLGHKVILPTIEADTPFVQLLRTTEAQNNWTFKKSDPSTWEVHLQKIVLNKGTLKMEDTVSRIKAVAIVDSSTESDADGYGIKWTMTGNYNTAGIKGGGRAGAVLSLEDEKTPYPIEASVQVGKTYIGVKGTLTKPASLAALDMHLSLSGDSMAHLYPLTGVLLPETPPFKTEGRLIGKLDSERKVWTYEKFTGLVGSSDLNGTLQYTTAGDDVRPLLAGTLESKLLRLEDLGPLIGADDNAKKQQRGAAERQPTDKVLPVKQFQTTSWGALNADVHFTGKQIIRDKDLPITNLVADLHMKDKVLSLTPLQFGVAGGTLASNIKLDGRTNNIKAEVKTSARGLKIQELAPKLKQNQTSFGQINGDASLSATGNSIGSMLATSNGELKALIDHGAISKLLLEEAGLNAGNVVVAKLFGDKEVKLNCLASDFSITNGLMDAKTFLLDTDDALITVTGTVNLAQELLDLKINPKSKGVRVISLRAPLYVKGTFAKPAVSVDAGVLAMRAGGAVALGLLAAPAALLPLITSGSTADSDCAHFLAQAREKPVAPPPGQTNKRK